MNQIIRLLTISIIASQVIQCTTPLGMLTPYEISIKLRKPFEQGTQFNAIYEASYNTHGYATDKNEEESFIVNPLRIYEKHQNIVAMYQGFGPDGATAQALTTPFTQRLDSIAGGPGKGVSNLQNGIYTPKGKLSCEQVSFSVVRPIKNGFYISASIPFCIARLSNVRWKYEGNNTLFAGEQIQQELINSFQLDAKKYFGLNIGNWKQQGLGDLTIMFEWDKGFIQRKKILRSVQANIRVGISIPTGVKTNEHIIMPVPFGADGAVGLPFGGGLSLNLNNIAEIGFSGQFWYFWSNEKLRRIKSFPTQTTLLLPSLTQTYKEFSFIQNFNLHAQLFSLCKRFFIKSSYQYWRKQQDRLTPISTTFNFEVVNSAQNIEDATYHNLILTTGYSPLSGDFNKVIPQFELFWKPSVTGTRVAIASSYGAQLSITF